MAHIGDGEKRYPCLFAGTGKRGHLDPIVFLHELPVVRSDVGLIADQERARRAVCGFVASMLVMSRQAGFPRSATAQYGGKASRQLITGSTATHSS